MLTIASYVQIGLLVGWDSPGAAQPLRNLFVSKRFLEEFNALPDLPAYGLARRGPSAKEALEALMNRFVLGQPPVQLIRRLGPGMHPLVKRMPRPNQAVAYLRTEKLRVFGFFHRPNSFVAHTVQTAAEIKATNGYRAQAAGVARLMSRLSQSEIDESTDAEHLVS